MRRTRLSRKGTNPAHQERLRREVRSEVQTYSDKMLKDFASSPEHIRRTDPMMQFLWEESNKELSHRKELKKLWGKKPLVPPKGKMAIPPKMQKSFKFFKLWLALPERVYEGHLEHDVEHASNYFFDKLDHFLHKGRDAKERWHQFAVAHHLARVTTTDYIAKGYDIVNRFPYDADPDVLKVRFRSYKQRFPSLVVVPTDVEGRKYYDLMAKTKT